MDWHEVVSDWRMRINSQSAAGGTFVSSKGQHFMTEHLFFYMGLCLIFIHEMDAVRVGEWRIFPGLSLLKEKTGYLVFTLIHIPLYYWFFWGLSQSEMRESLIRGLSWFFVIHLGLHLLFLMHKQNPFRSFFSWAIIASAGLMGLLEILIEP